MITDIDTLYNRHLLSRHQIATHFGQVDDTHVFHTDEVFQTVEAFFQIVDALQAEKIDFIPLKGPALSYHIYRDYSCRRYYDLDLLVDFEDADRFASLLADYGYQPPRGWPTKGRGQEELRLKSNQHLFQHRQNGADVEIHWRLFSNFRFPAISFSELYHGHTMSYLLDGRSIRKLSNELELLYLLIHGANHAWFRLKWLVDVNDYIRNVAVDYDALHAMAAKNGLLRMLSYYNAVAKAYIPDARPIPGVKDTIPYYVRRHTDRQIRKKPPEKKEIAIGLRRSVRAAVGVYLLANYLAPDWYSRFMATRNFFVGISPRKLAQVLRPLDFSVNRVVKKPFLG